MLDFATIISKKYPGNEWVINDNDYETLVWLSDNPKPTKSELELTGLALEEELAQDKIQNQAKRSAALAKLEALGLDEDDLKALGL